MIRKTSDVLYSSLFCIFKESLLNTTKVILSVEKDETFSVFLFLIVVYSDNSFIFCRILWLWQSFCEDCFSFFRSVLSAFLSTFHSMARIGIGCSLSVAKVVSGFYGQKDRGDKPFRRQSPHFHFIAGSILAVSPVYPKPSFFYATETKRLPRRKKTYKIQDIRDIRKRRLEQICYEWVSNVLCKANSINLIQRFRLFFVYTFYN